MTVNCVSTACGNRIDDRWHFCPYCGTDNRPPNQRRPVRAHQHQLIHGQGCCIWCGDEADEPYNLTTTKRKVIGSIVLWLGLATLGVVLYLFLIRFGMPLPFKDWVNSWWSQTSLFRVRVFFMSTHQIGPTFCFYASILGVILTVSGFFILRKRELPDFDDFWD